MARNILPVPQHIITTRFPRTKKFRLGERRKISVTGIAQPNETVTWGAGTAFITDPSGAIETIETITPQDSRYDVLVDFDELGIWEIVFVYGTVPSSASEIIEEVVRVRIV